MTGMAAAVLAGGKNSRMKGKNKAFLSAGGVPVIVKSLNVLRSIFQEIIIVTNFRQDFAVFEKDSVITQDLIKDRGPLGGIHSALTVTKEEAVFFVACDMPNLHNESILCLVNYFCGSNFDAVVPRIKSFIEPLHGIYRKRLKDKLGIFLRESSNYSVRSFLRTVNTGYLDLEDTPLNREIFCNWNTPEDLKGSLRQAWK